MWDFLLGELGLPPRTARGLTWPELDSYLAGYDVRLQRQMAGFRLVAAQVYNVLAEQPLSPAAYLPLPAVDGPPAAPAVGGESMAEFRARLAAQNTQTLAARAAATD